MSDLRHDADSCDGSANRRHKFSAGKYQFRFHVPAGSEAALHVSDASGCRLRQAGPVSKVWDEPGSDDGSFGNSDKFRAVEYQFSLRDQTAGEATLHLPDAS